MVTLEVTLQARDVLGHDVGDVLGIGIAARPVVEQQPAVMTYAELGHVLVELDYETGFRTGRAKVGLRPAEGD
jgi:hypothetical protein